MRVDLAFPSKWIKAADLDGKEYTMTMQRVAMEHLDEKQGDKLVLFFSGTTKGLMLNKTNAEAIAIVYGNETDHWIGKRVILYPDVTQYQGQRVHCVRVRPVRQDGGQTPFGADSQTPLNAGGPKAALPENDNQTFGGPNLGDMDPDQDIPF